MALEGGGLLAELKRRNMFRVAAGYIVFSWLVLQVGDVLFPAFGLGDVGVRYLLGVLILGCPLVLAFSWLFEVTPDGLKWEREVDRSASVTGATGRLLNKLTIVGLSVAVAFFTVDKFVWSAAEAEELSTDGPSIAVLPFADMSESQDQEWFSDGVSEELLNVLARIPDLRVIARTSSFQFKGEDLDVRRIADTLGVAHVLEGSVRRSGNALRISVRLSSGSDGSEVWSNQYDRIVDDVFQVQDEIASAVVDELRVSFLGGALDRPTPANTEVYDLFLQARYFADSLSEADLNRALELLTAAIELDPSFAPAWGQRAAVYANLALAGAIQSDSAGRLQVADLERARELDPDDPLALSRRAMTLGVLQWEWDEGRQAMARALVVAPTDPRVAGNAATLASAYGELDEALRLATMAVRADPLNPNLLAGLAYAHYSRGEFIEAEEAWLAALEFRPGSAFYLYRVSNARMLAGDVEGALDVIGSIAQGQWGVAALPMIQHARGLVAQSDQALADLIERYSDVNPVSVAEAYAYRGEVDEAFRWLNRSFDMHALRLAYLKHNPLLTNLRGDPRFPELVSKLGLPVRP